MVCANVCFHKDQNQKMAQKYSQQIIGRLFWFVANAQILNKQHKYDYQSKRNEKLKFTGYLIS